ncbi:MAG: glutamine synthetase family protein [Bacteroidales bacterium]|jgi:glutamine synthetase|nr:glutamine synthetase family protein [Bacteroidales bacterium]
MINTIELNANPLVRAIGKLPKDFTKADIMRYIEENGIMMIDFHYVAGDGRLKTLNFVINDKEYLDQILTLGERVDGSSLFGFMEAGKSDIYVLPRFSTAFINPFKDQLTISFLCSYFHKSGNFLQTSAEFTLRKAIDSFSKVTGGMEFYAMGELEYYVISEREENFNAEDQKGYHEATPFAKFEDFRTDAMLKIAECGGKIKYGHSEVGNFAIGDKYYEQNEIEFLPVPVLEAADQILIAKWIIRTLANEYGYNVTFAPKITVGKAGSGMHIHTQIIKDGINMYVEDGELSQTAKKAIAGFMQLAGSVTAFGNTNPTSYLRLVPNQEAPTTICWGDRNRSTLVRVPLGWRTKLNMSHIANPLEDNNHPKFLDKQSIEFRASDCTANIYLLLAALVVAAREGFETKDAMAIADRTYVAGNIHKEDANIVKIHHLESLPSSCVASADRLQADREKYEKYDVFSKELIDATIAKLRSYQDGNLREELEKNSDKMLEFVNKYFHC